ncbi:MAG TPA: class I SAM-dependent methyltransferase [Verrucomicrobiae bacterium]|nr:class I SAM-dependent methyltransferase [Verrucomicrobiae bacterium]
MMAENKEPGTSLRRRVKQLFKSQLHTLFAQGQRLGFDILPRHFYSEIPDLRVLRRTTSWQKPYSMKGVSGVEPGEQLAWLKDMVPPEVRSRLKQQKVHQLASKDNGEAGYGPVEADALYCFILQHKPRQIFQIGCGVSTAVCLRAAAEASYRPRIICVEPYPNPFLLGAATKGDIELVKEKVQDTDAGLAAEMRAGDLFFVDSSHTLGPAGEVTRIMLEFLPRLHRGVYIHFHDIYFPYDYPGDILDNALFFTHETALLMAFLSFNPHFRILCSLGMLHHKRQEELSKMFPSYNPARYQGGVRIGEGHFPSSIFLQRVSD